MSAPGSVELDEDVLVVVDDELVVGVSDHHGHGSLLRLGDRLGLDAGLDLALQDILDELTDFLGDDLLRLVVGVLGVLGDVVDHERGKLGGVEVEVSRVGAKRLGVDGGDVDLTLELLGDGLELLGERGALLLGLREDVRQGDAGLSDVVWSALMSIDTMTQKQGRASRAKLTDM